MQARFDVGAVCRHAWSGVGVCRAAAQGGAMTLLTWMAAGLALGLAAWLVYALLNAEEIG